MWDVIASENYEALTRCKRPSMRSSADESGPENQQERCEPGRIEQHLRIAVCPDIDEEIGVVAEDLAPDQRIDQVGKRETEPDHRGAEQKLPLGHQGQPDRQHDGRDQIVEHDVREDLNALRLVCRAEQRMVDHPDEDDEKRGCRGERDPAPVPSVVEPPRQPETGGRQKNVGPDGEEPEHRHQSPADTALAVDIECDADDERHHDGQAQQCEKQLRSRHRFRHL